MSKEKWTKQKILQTCLYLIPKKNSFGLFILFQKFLLILDKKCINLTK